MNIYEYVFMGHDAGMRVDRVVTLHEECLEALQTGAEPTYIVERRDAARFVCAWPLCPEKTDWAKVQAQTLREAVAR